MDNMFKYLKKIRLHFKNIFANKFVLSFATIFFFDFKLANGASDAPAFSLANTDFVVAISFFIFDLISIRSISFFKGDSSRTSFYDINK